jgi:hypothetical protein
MEILIPIVLMIYFLLKGKSKRNKSIDIIQDKLNFEKFHNQITNCTSFSNLKVIAENYDGHSYYLQSIGQYALREFEEYDFAKMQFINAISVGLKYPEEYFNSKWSHSFGASISFLLAYTDAYKFLKNKDGNWHSSNYKDLKKAMVVAYLFISNCIKKNKNIMGDSHAERSLLLMEKNMIWGRILVEEYRHLLGSTSKQDSSVLTIYDNVMAAKFYQSVGHVNMGNKNLMVARNTHNLLEDIAIAGKDANRYSLNEIAELGRRRHNRIFDTLSANYSSEIANLDLNIKLLKNCTFDKFTFDV